MPTIDSATGAGRYRALVLGAGNVGSAAAFDLSRQQTFDVTVVDTSAARLREVARLPRVTPHSADAADAPTLEALAASHDVVIGALPSVLGYRAIESVIGRCRAVVDISFMPEDPLALDTAAQRAGTTVVVDCGVAPGLSHMMAGDAARQLELVDTIKIYVGGLPAERSGPFEYKAGFSPYDVIEEYVRPARIVENFEVAVREGLSDVELVDVAPIGRLEAFLTDGLRTLTTTVRARSMIEKTLRYPGHARLMRAFRDAGFFSTRAIDVGGAPIRPLDVTAALLFPLWSFAHDEPDVTILQVVVSGINGSQDVTYRWEMIDRYDPQSRLHSMARTTAFPATIVAALAARGQLPPGVHPPETIGKLGLLDHVLEELARRGVTCRRA